MSARIDCDLLTGFLGSGKTTLLNAWLRTPASAGTAVVVNEVGDIGVDQLVLAQVAENVLLLESGCLCCTLSGSLRETLLDLYAAARKTNTALTRIVIETTGLAEPLPILHSLLGDKILTDTIRLNQVIVTIDGMQGVRQLASQPESVRQLAAAECIVITKGDLATPQALAELYEAIAAINPMATLIESVNGDAAEQVFTANAGASQRQAVIQALGHSTHAFDDDHHCDHEHTSGHRHTVFHSRVSTLGFYIDHEISWSGLAAWWHLVSHHYGDDMLRTKGLLHINDSTQSTIFLQTVGKVFHTPDVLSAWPDTDQRSRLVCIGVGLDEHWLRSSLAALRIDEPGLMPSTLADLTFLVSTQSR
jgi:G3E family GTPase